jgi:hypothetical protein
MKKLKHIKLFENFTDGDNKYPSSITVKPTDKFKSKLKDIKNSDGISSILASNEFNLYRNGDRFNLVKVATTPFEVTTNELDGKSFIGKQDDYWLSYNPEYSEIYVRTSRIFGTKLLQGIDNFNNTDELTNTDIKYATEHYRELGLIWIGGYYCKFEKGFEVGQKDTSGYFEITKVGK